MIIDNSITGKRIKKILTPKTVAIILLIVAIVSTVFYITVENRDSKEILIWHITSDTKDLFTDEQLKLVNEYGAEKGIDRILMTKRHPEDRYFDAAMSTSAYYNCDIFIMSAEMVAKYAESDMFKVLSYSGENELLYVGDDAIGILICENYYLLINERTDVDLQIIYDIFEILIGN